MSRRVVAAADRDFRHCLYGKQIPQGWLFHPNLLCILVTTPVTPHRYLLGAQVVCWSTPAGLWADHSPSSPIFWDNKIPPMLQAGLGFISALEEEMGGHRKPAEPFLHSACTGVTQGCVSCKGGTAEQTGL